MSQAGLIDIEHANPQIPTQFDADSGNAIPIGNVLNIFGGAGIETSGSGNTITIALTGGGAAIDALTTDVSGPVTPDGAGNVDVTGTSIFSDGSVANTLTLNVQATENTLLYGQGANTNVAEVGPLSDGQLLIGATGSAPVAANLTSADGSITINEGAGSIDLSVSSSDDAILTLTGDAGGAVSPTGGNIDVQGVTVANAANAKPLFIQGTPGSSLIEADIQVAAAITGAPGDKNDAGLASFDDTEFTVDSDGFVQLLSGPVPQQLGTYNLGLTYSAGTATIRGADGNALSASNPGYVVLPSNVTEGGKVTFTLTSNFTFDDSAGTSVFAGSLFGMDTGDTTSGDGVLRFFLYAGLSSDDSEQSWFVSRIPNWPNLSSSFLSNAGSGSADRAVSLLALETITIGDYQNQNCLMVGSFAANINGSDDWTILGVDYSAGFNSYNVFNNLLMNLGIQGAAASSHFLANGGTAPTISDNKYRYMINPTSNNVQVSMDMTLSGSPSGAVDALINLPLLGTNTSILPMAGGVFYDGGRSGNVYPVYFQRRSGETNARQAFLLKGDGTSARWQYSEFASGDILSAQFSYRLD